jgi:Holliday junction DNA helicase RuvB
MAVLFRQPQLSLYCANDPDLRNAPENTRNAVSREPLIQPDDDSNDDQRQLRPQSETTNDDVRLLRPQSMNEMIGQRDVYERLKIAVDAADKRDDTLGHILLDGPPGLGKTTFALCIPRDLGVPVQLTSGPALTAPKDLVPYLTNASERSILFIDEIHRLPKAVEEYLYTAMEDYRVDIVHGEGTNARTLNLWLKPFTLIGATTRAGLLSAPLRDRFPLREHLDFYEPDEISTIVRRSAAIFGAEIDDQSCEEIAQRSRGTPRVANNLLRWIRDYATSKADGHIQLSITKAALEMAGIDDLGLGRHERKYLTTLIRVFSGGPAGLEAIAHTMNIAPDTLSDEVEPFLLRSEFLVRTPRGRVVTAKTYGHLGMEAGGAPPTGQSQLF